MCKRELVQIGAQTIADTNICLDGKAMLGGTVSIHIHVANLLKNATNCTYFNVYQV